MTTKYPKGAAEVFVYPTSLDDFTACAHLFELKKVLEMPSEPSAQVVLGNCVDAAINANLISMRDAGKPLDKQDYLGLIDAEWRRLHAANDYDWGKHNMDPDLVRRKADECAALHYDKIAPGMKPQHVQHLLRLHIGDGIYVGGFPDVLEHGGRIRDNKCARKRKKDDQLPITQATCYVLAAQHGGMDYEVTAFQVDYLVWDEGHRVYHDPRPIVVTQQNINFVIDQSRRFAAAVRSGVYPRIIPGSHWKCSAKWCDHWKHCWGASTFLQHGATP